MKVQVNKVMSYQGPAVQYRGDDGWPAMAVSYTHLRAHET
jgi:hypothetical protein